MTFPDPWTSVQETQDTLAAGTVRRPRGDRRGAVPVASDPGNLSTVRETTVGHDRPAATGWLGRLRDVWAVAEFSAAYLAVIAMAEVLLVMILLDLPLTPAPLVGGLITFAIYVNDRLVDLAADGRSNPQRTSFVRRHRQKLYVLGAIAYGLGAALAALGGPAAFGLAILPGVAWTAYAVDWVPTDAAPFERLKEIVVVNSVIVATAWALPVVLLPVAWAGAGITPLVAVAFAYLLLATFVNAEIANVRDVAADSEAGVATLPTTLGIKRTKLLLAGLTLLGLGLVAGGAGAGIVGSRAAAILATGYVALLGVVALVGRRVDHNTLTIAAECTRLPVFVLLVAVAVA